MAQYIPKEPLVVEIERRIADNKKDIERASHKNLEDYFEGYEDALTLFKEQFLDTLEVKEVDLEKELIEWHKEHFKKDGTFIRKSGFYLTNNSQMDIAKHFFELGLKSQKGE